MKLDELSQKWWDKGQFKQIEEHKIFYYDSQNQKPILCVLHGFPTSSFDYYKALVHLEKHYRVIIHDHLGFGFSDKPQNYSYSLIEQADVALELWKQLGVHKAQILGHDYGTSVLTEILARKNKDQIQDFDLESVTFCNGSVHIEMAQLRFIQKLLLNPYLGPIVGKLSSKRTLTRNLKNIYFDPNQLSQQEIDSIWNMMLFNDGRSVIAKTAVYIKERYKYWHRWIGAIKKSDLNINILWAQNDKIAVEKIAHTIDQESQNSQLSLIKDCGHFPMLEQAELWAKKLIELLARNNK